MFGLFIIQCIVTDRDCVGIGKIAEVIVWKNDRRDRAKK